MLVCTAKDLDHKDRERLAGAVTQVIRKDGRQLEFLGAEISEAVVRVELSPEPVTA